MMIRRRRGWELPDSAATPEQVYMSRRELVASLGLGTAWVAAGALTPSRLLAATEEDDPSAHLYPVERNPRYVLDRDITEEDVANKYNNFYEFGSHKSIWQAAQALPIRPWTVAIDGMVEKEMTVDIDDLLAKMPLEERLYRHRCVEAWSMAVPWSGFPLEALVRFAAPLGSAQYIRMETFLDPDVAPGQKQVWYPWPYIEGLTMAEATNELAFMATGIYGKAIAKQHGAPLRLAAPWKYGFKSIKSIVRLTFTDERPVSFWEEIQGAEYGFWANVNPAVAHPRWSQATELVLGTGKRVPTQIFNGYGEFVADLYQGLEDQRLYA